MIQLIENVDEKRHLFIKKNDKNWQPSESFTLSEKTKA